MNVRRAVAGWALAAGLSGGALQAATPGMEALFDNGRSFSVVERRLPLRCLDEPGLLALGEQQQAQLLDQAAAAGFNAVSFEAPLFGPQGLSRAFGKVDAGASSAFTRSLEACGLRGLYAFPVLYPPAGVDGLVGTATARSVFFAGRNSWAWQCWALRQASELKVDGVPLTQAPVVGGWILYRGPWPGGSPLRADAGAPAALSASAAGLAKARLGAWVASTVKYARKLGFRQELGVGLWAKDDLPLALPAPEQSADASSAGAPPVAALADENASAEDLQHQSDSLDVLPPVAGASAASLDDSAVVPAAPDSPWDLEGLDWPAVEGLFSALPMASQLDFLEFSLDSEDWYAVGGRLAQAADKAEVPVLWRQDWRSASRFERGKHLEAPAPLAGLSGPWPQDDWPASGQALWTGDSAAGPESAPFRVQSVQVGWDGDAMVLAARLTRPAGLSAQWGTTLPLSGSADAQDEPGMERRVTLTGVAKGAWFLVKLVAHSPRYGVCVVRTHWVRAPR